MRDTAILLLNLGGPVNLDQVEPFLTALFGDRELIRLPGPAWLQGPFSKLIAKLRAPGARKRYAQIGGGSPLLRESAFQASALRTALRAAGRQEAVKLCFRNASPRAAGLLKALKLPGHHQARARDPLSPRLPGHHGIQPAGTGGRGRQGGMEILPGVEHYATDPEYLDALEAPSGPP